MELPSRDKGDELLKSGELTVLRRRLRIISRRHDLAVVVVCAYDHRTRMLPFLYADLWMAPAGVMAIGGAVADAGFAKTRIVLEQWNRNFRPSLAKIDGRTPDLLLVSSLQIHAASCEALIRDACRMDPAHRPLIVVGGPMAIYQPWTLFSTDPRQPWSADVVVTGEEYVLLSLLEVVLSSCAEGEPLRSAFARARDTGMLDDIPGLVYPVVEPEGVPRQLMDTGIARLAANLEELSDPAIPYRLLEPPGGKSTLGPCPLPAGHVRKFSPIASLVMTFGCRWSCGYCPIPAYNQRKHRMKSGGQIAQEMSGLHREFGFRHFCGVGGNFFNDSAKALEIVHALADTWIHGEPLNKRVEWGTEATVCDSLHFERQMPLLRQAGLRALWLGVEDMTGAVVRKGQTVDNTLRLFSLLRANGIFPMPMLMHHDAQPLLSRGSAAGLLNQVHRLRNAGAIDLQVLMTTPAVGSAVYDRAFESGFAYRSVGGRDIDPCRYSDIYVVASGHPYPWRKQLNVLAAYAYFFNPLQLVAGLFRWPGKLALAGVGAQLLGMWGLAPTARHILDWAYRLWRGPLQRAARAPASAIPMRNPAGGPASHALPGTPLPGPTGSGTATDFRGASRMHVSWLTRARP